MVPCGLPTVHGAEVAAVYSAKYFWIHYGVTATAAASSEVSVTVSAAEGTAVAVSAPAEVAAAVDPASAAAAATAESLVQQRASAAKRAVLLLAEMMPIVLGSELQTTSAAVLHVHLALQRALSA